MEPFITFATTNPEPSESLAIARVGGQEGMLLSVVDSIYTDLVNQTATQEEMLQSAYQPLISTASYTTERQGSILDSVVDTLTSHLSSTIATNEAILASLPTETVIEFGDDGKTIAKYTKTDSVPGQPTPAPIVDIPGGGGVVGVVCGVGETVLVLREEVNTAPKPSHWLVVRCGEDCTATVEAYLGVEPPEINLGGAVHGPYDSLPTPEDRERLALACAAALREGVPPDEADGVPTNGEVVDTEVPSPDVEPGADTPVPDEDRTVPPQPGELADNEATLQSPPYLVPSQATWDISTPDICRRIDQIIAEFKIIGEWAKVLIMNTVADVAESLDRFAAVQSEGRASAVAEVEGAKPGSTAGLLGRLGFTPATLFPETTEAILAGTVDSVDLSTGVSRAVASRAFPETFEAIRAFQELVSDGASGIADVLRQSANVALRTLNTHAGANATALLGLYFFRATLTSLENVQLGLNFVAWATTTVSVGRLCVTTLVDYLINYLFPVTIPTVADVQTLYLNDEIGERHAACLTALNGEQWEMVRKQIHAVRDRPTADEVVRDWMRFRENPVELAKRLRTQGWTDQNDIDLAIRSRQFLPPPSDLIRFAVRDLFDPNKLGKAEMLEELKQNKDLIELFAAQGIERIEIRTANGEVLQYDIPALYWMASYDEVSPTQVFEMSHRLRANRVGRYQLSNKDGTTSTPEPVTIETVRSLLKEKDYNPIWRDRLAAISYRVPGRIDVRRIYGLGGYGQPRGLAGFNLAKPGEPVAVGVAEKELVEQYLDMGYSPTDSTMMGWYTAAEFSRTSGVKDKARKLKAICRAYTLGVIDRKEATDRSLKVTGDANTAASHIDQCDFDRQLSDVNAAVNSTRRLLVRGEIDERRAREILNGVGINPQRVAQYIQSWNLQRVGRSREVTASTIMTWYDEGIIDRNTALTRLVNLEYPRDDANRMLRHVELGDLARRSKELRRIELARERKEASLAKQRERSSNKQQRETTDRFKRFLAGRSDKNLRDWLKQSLITVQEVRDTLLARGMRADDVERWLTVVGSGGNDSEGRGNG